MRLAFALVNGEFIEGKQRAMLRQMLKIEVATHLRKFPAVLELDSQCKFLLTGS
jgi:hypothetical protein